MNKKDWEKELMDFELLWFSPEGDEFKGRLGDAMNDKAIPNFINSLLVKQKKESYAKGYVEGLCENPSRKLIEKEIIEKLEKRFAPVDHSHSLIPHGHGNFYPESGEKIP